MADTASGELCTQCGLCCAGALFDYGALDPKEAATARATGMDVVEADGQSGFHLPCPQLDGASCRIYAERPQTCRSYRCKVLRGLEEGDITWSEAQERVEQAHAAMDYLAQQLPAGAHVSDARRWRRETADAGGIPSPHASPMLMMALGMLDLVLDKHFRRVDQRQVMPRD